METQCHSRRKSERWAEGEAWGDKASDRAGAMRRMQREIESCRWPAAHAESWTRADKAGSRHRARPEVRGHQRGVGGGPAQGLDTGSGAGHQPRTVPPALTDQTHAQRWGRLTAPEHEGLPQEDLKSRKRTRPGGQFTYGWDQRSV